MSEEKRYDASSIKVLEGLEAVRKRPAMYIGDTGSKGVHHLVWEVIDNSVDEALAGRATRIDVRLYKDGSVSVRDNGRGIPVDMHESGKTALEVILTKLHAGGKFDKGSYQVSGGLHGVGVSVVNALAEWLEVEVFRDGKVHKQGYAFGEPTGELKVIGDTDQTGSMLRFKPDGQIMEVVEFSYEVLRKRLRELAYLMGTMGLSLSITLDENTDESQEFCFPDGLKDFVGHLNHAKQVINEEAVYIKKARARPGRRDQGLRRRARAAVQRRLQRERLHLRQQHQHDRRWHAPRGLPQALTRTPQQLRAHREVAQAEGATVPAATTFARD